jgi:hypothetical protein
LISSVLVAAVAAAAQCLAPASATAAPAAGDYTCATFSLGPAWVDATGGSATMSGSGNCAAQGARYSASLSLGATVTVSCTPGSLSITGPLTISDGVNPPVSTSATISLDGTSSGAHGTITLASGQQGVVTATMTRFILSPGDFCTDRTEPVDLTLRGSFASTSL